MDIHEKIKSLREKKGWSQIELAKKLDCHPTYISRVETGKHTPSLELIKKLVKLFDINFDYLLDEDLDNYEVKIEDKNLAERMKLVDTLEERQRAALIEVIDSMLTQKRMMELLTNKGELMKSRS